MEREHERKVWRGSRCKKHTGECNNWIVRVREGERESDRKGGT
jgi:hypothetical protein